VEAAGGQDLTTWPDRLVYDAAMCRGQAHAMQGDAASAEKDFLLARKATFDANQLAFANLALGNFYRDQVKDEIKALAAYNAVIESPVVGAAKYDSVIACAVLLAKKGDEKEAIAQLDKLGMENITSADWRCRIQQAYGDVYVALKRPDAALAAYRKALEIPDVSKYMVKAIEERIAGMTPK
jgi:tetratricopeptide (TPR) repeat protein